MKRIFGHTTPALVFFSYFRSFTASFMKGRKSLYFIREHLDREVYHGGIGNVDAERIFLKKGMQPVYFPYHYSFSIKAKLARFFYLIKTFISLPRGSYLFFQFPLYARMNKLLLRLLRFRKSIRIVCMIADINGLKDGDKELLRNEKDELKTYSWFIVHGPAMENWLISFHPQAKTARLNFFDFLAPISNRAITRSPDIAFAGNLEKSSFLEHLGDLSANCPGLTFRIYGKDPTDKLLNQGNVKYEGFAEPYQLPALIKGSFGLLWDGEDISGPGGSLGDYMEYISHHKLSLYVLSGLPIIAPSMAGSAQMVINLNIGFTIKSLGEIEGKINGLTEMDYQQMRKNMLPLANRIANGDNLSEAIDQILGM